MNKDNAKDFLPLVQALADGKTIQLLDINGNWGNIDELTFMSNPSMYRIKPEPREWWICVNTGTDPNHSNANPIIRGCEQYLRDNSRQQIRVREILD